MQLEHKLELLDWVVVLSLEDGLKVADLDAHHARHEILVAEELKGWHRKSINHRWLHTFYLLYQNFVLRWPWWLLSVSLPRHSQII